MTLRSSPSRGNSVLHVITSLEVGGAETVLSNIATASVGAQRRIMVVTLRGGGAFEASLAQAGVPIVSLLRGSGPSETNYGIAEVLRQCQRFAPDVIVGWMYHGALLAGLVSRFACRRVPMVWNFRCTIDDRPNWPWSTRFIIALLRRFSRRADHIIYNSEAGREQHQADGFSGRSSQVIVNGVDTLKFTPDATARANIRAELGIPAAAFVVGHVARFHRMKGHALMVQAVQAARFSKEVWLVMAGKGVDTGNRILGEQLQNANGAAKVLLLGTRTDIPRLMTAFDCLCLTSNGGEGFPNVLLEAMSCGVPCVTYDVGDAATIVAGVGTVVTPNVDALRAAIVSHATADPEAQARWSAAARERVLQRYSVQQMIDLYDRALDGMTRL